MNQVIGNSHNIPHILIRCNIETISARLKIENDLNHITMTQSAWCMMRDEQHHYDTQFHRDISLSILR